VYSVSRRSKAVFVGSGRPGIQGLATGAVLGGRGCPTGRSSFHSECALKLNFVVYPLSSAFGIRLIVSRFRGLDHGRGANANIRGGLERFERIGSG
jgi:hypothetical protein